ncbi:hypothetical protein CAPTEDRAFT_185521 [Capitella teleta]|uniref:Uncharacterized protein n=1 Tax=Capitella teleta TaxID=283909 RepID=R7TRR7_CAPTE|nr:hypothetical protein CAPTEDRAFT_185521 [Capitella teleta]|eukprot:ELT96277.1 hypothetical protein CAPTEDRAFT_185521 [Capitella teleta]
MTKRGNLEARPSDLAWDYSASTPLLNNDTTQSSVPFYSDDKAGLHLNHRQVLYLIRNMDESGQVLRNAISAPSSLLSPPEWLGPRAESEPPTSTPVQDHDHHWGWKVLSIEVCFIMVLSVQMPVGILVVQIICCVIYFISFGCSVRLLWHGIVSWRKALISFLSQLFIFAGVNSLVMFLDAQSWTLTTNLWGPDPAYPILFCIFIHDSICSSSFGGVPSTIPSKWYSLLSNSIQDVLSYGHFLWFVLCLVHRYHAVASATSATTKSDAAVRPSSGPFRPISSSPVTMCSDPEVGGARNSSDEDPERMPLTKAVDSQDP